MHTESWLENLNAGHYLNNLGGDGRTILEWIFLLEKSCLGMWNAFIWLRIGFIGRLF
jgi:hypothetical protein